jgi:S1-C subfamily serine protease
MAELTPDERVNCQVYENVNRSVVNINTKGYRGDRFFLIELPSEGAGSGVVLDRRGHVLTNCHVVDGAREIEVALFDRKTYDAQLVGQDLASDVAVIKIDAPPDVLYPVSLGDSTRLRVGQNVFAIGNPFGLERTMSTGIISSLNRTIPSRLDKRNIRQVIQIDCSINPGNSGGPLLDSRSRMIGMNTAIASSTGESVGVGFAIPVSTIARVVPQLIQTGHVIRPDAGIDALYVTDQGLIIMKLVEGGGAERAGLRGPQIIVTRKRQGPFVYEQRKLDVEAADIITAVDGKPVETADDFLAIIDSKTPGDTVQITVLREGRPMNVAVRLDAGQ